MPITFEDDDAPVAAIAPPAALNGHAPESFETAQPARVILPPAQAFTTRQLPHSLESEEHLLACILLDGTAVLPKCAESGVTGVSFYNPANGLIYETLAWMARASHPIDVSTLRAELSSRHELDQVGGFARMVSLSSLEPTTAQASFYISKVRDLQVLRDTIRAATTIVENAYAYTGDIDAFTSDSTARLARAATATSPLRAALTVRQFNATRRLEKPRVIYAIADTTICTPGNLTTIYSQAKTGKSSLVGAMLAAAMTTPTGNHDTLGITGPNYAKQAILHFDTEQSPYDWQRLVLTAMRRVGLSEAPPWLLSYTLTGAGALDCAQMVELAMRDAHARHKGIHSVIIDGVADLVTDPNNPEECFPLVTRLHKWAIELDTTIISILHMNPGSEVKGRGHLGSQLERKSESNLTLTKDGEVTSITSMRQRGKSIPKDKAPSFKWSDDHMMHRSCGTPESLIKTKGGRPESHAFEIYRSVIPKKTEPALPLTQLANRCAVNRPISAKQLFNVLPRWIEQGFIECVEDERGRRYRMAV